MRGLKAFDRAPLPSLKKERQQAKIIQVEKVASRSLKMIVSIYTLAPTRGFADLKRFTRMLTETYLKVG